MKKFFIFAILIIIQCPVFALWYNRLSDSTVRVIYNASYDTISNWQVVIPNTVYMNFSSDPVYRTYKVVAIKEGAFMNCTNVVSLTIGLNVTTIGNDAFRGCTGLDGKLIIPNSVTSIGQYAFANCSGIDTLVVGENVSTIGSYAFDGCAGIRTLFYNAKNCTSQLCYGTSSPFYGAIQSHMQKLIIGEAVQSLPQYAFQGCTGLDGKLIMPNSLTSIPQYAFANCSGIDTLVIGENVVVIGNYVFQGCTGLDGKLIIPNNVTSIGQYAFYNCSGIDTLVVGENVETIGNYAFQGCIGINTLYYNARNCSSQLCSGTSSPFYGAIQSHMHKLIIGEAVQSMPQYAFHNCSGIDTLVVGENVETIGNYAFQGCIGISTLYYNAKDCTTSLCGNNSSPFYGAIQSYMQKLIVGEAVQSLPQWAFRGCTGLDGKLIISNSVTSIGQNAFANCSGIDTLVVGENVSTIGSYAFQGCTGISTLYYNAKDCTTSLCGNNSSPFYGAIQSHMQKLIIGEAVQSLPQYAFQGCTGLDGKLIMPNSLTSIPQYAFANCSGIDTLVIGENVVAIGNYVFQGCTGLDGKLIIPNNVTSIGQYAFYNCSGIDTLVVGENVETIGNYAFRGCTGLDGKLIMSNSVISIGQYAFYNCSGIDTLVVGENVETIGNYAFQGCIGINTLYYNARNCSSQLCYGTSSPFYGAIQSHMHKLIIGEAVQSMPQYAFQGCTGLDGKLIMPNSLTSIPQYAFANCSGIDTLVIRENIVTIGNCAFQGCTGIQKLYYNARSCTTQLCYNANSPFYGAMQTNLHTLVLGDSVESIPPYAFRGCTALTGNLKMPNRIRTVGPYAFYNCSGLTGMLTLPDSVVNVNNYVFSGCTGIDTLSLSDATTSIGQQSFSNCTNLTYIQFSPSLQSIGTKAFYNCDNLLSIDIDSAQVALGDSAFADCDRLVTANLGTNATSIGIGTFAGDFRLATVNMGHAVTSIGNDAFRDCVRLTSPVLSNALTSIGSNAFNGCSLVMGQLNFPENITSIGAGAYSGCSGVTSLLMKPQNPPTIYATTFDSININIPVYVPCGRVLNYYVTDYWENFPNILEMEPYQVNLSVNNDAMGSVSITSQPSCSNPQAIIVATANEGFHFIHWSDGNTNNPRVLSLNQDTSLVANFTVNQAYITVQSNDSVKGHVTGSGLYVYNAPVVIMATSNEGYHFIHWNDGNTQNPRYVIARQDSVFTAVFVSNISNITVFNNNPEMGTVSGSGIYYYQNYATLSATPNYGYHFTHWNDGNIDNPRMHFVDRDTSFTASFALNVYAISASSENTTMGSVSGGGNYTYNMQISLTADPNFGYHFSQWSDGNTQNPRTVVVNKDSAFTAQFAANTYMLTVSSNDPDMGSAYGAGAFTFNSQTTISAAPNYGYHFTQWSDGNTENPRIVTVNGNHQYTAMFAINFYTITVNSSNPALGNASGGGSYNYNSSITITATPNYGYHFTQWSDGNTQNPRTVTVMQNATYTAQFAINNYAVSVNSNNSNMGVVLGSGSYVYNTPATISATPNYGYHFVQWNDGNIDNPRTFIVTQDRVFTALFDYNTYTLTALSNNYLAGNVTGGGTYNYLTVVSVNAVPNNHYHFVQWSDSVTDNPRNITMIKDTMLTAEFAIDQHTVYVQSSNATMGDAIGGGEYSYGSTIHLTAMPNYGYHFVQWSDGSTQNPRTMIVSQDMSITAMFDYNQYMADIQSSDTTQGAVSGSGTYPYLTAITIQALPVTGYHFTQWSDGETANPRTLTLSQDTLIVAQFAINMYIVDVQANDASMGNVTGTGSYPYQTTITVSANAAEHHHFVQWDDGNTSNPRQLQVISDIMLTAIFAEDDKFLINVLCPDTTMGYVTGGGEYYAGTQAILTAVPHNHYQFEHWIDGVTTNPRTITVLENATYVAVFSPVSYDILAYSANEMMGTVNGTGTYPYHTTVTLEAIASEGHHFVCWNDGDSNAVRTILVEGNAVYIATFAEGVGVEEFQDYPKVKIYPNPARETITIEGVTALQVEVLDMYGRVVLASDHSNTIFVKQLSTGTYILRIITDFGILERKVLKE